MLEYIVFGAVIVVAVAYLVLKNKQTKNNDEISLSNINERLGIIEAAQACAASIIPNRSLIFERLISSLFLVCLFLSTK